MKNTVLLFTVLLLLGSCTSDYRNALPSRLAAVLCAPPSSLGSFGLPDLSASGMSSDADLYLFETSDGYYGLLAEVSDAEKTKAWLVRQGQSDVMSRDDKTFVSFDNGFVAGLSSGALLVMGPVVPGSQKSFIRRMTSLLDRREPSESPLYHRLQGVEGGIRLVARSSAFPRQYVAPLVVGIPAGTSVDDVLFEARVRLSDRQLDVVVTPFSFDKRTDASLQQVRSSLKPLHRSSSPSLSAADRMVFYFHTDGDTLLQQLRRDEVLRVLLASAGDQELAGADAHHAIVIDRRGHPRITSDRPCFPSDLHPRLYAVVRTDSIDQPFLSRYLGHIRLVTIAVE